MYPSHNTDCCIKLFESLMEEKTNPNPSPTGKKFGFVLFGTPEGTSLHFCPCVGRAKIKVATSF